MLEMLYQMHLNVTIAKDQTGQSASAELVHVYPQLKDIKKYM